LLSSNGCSKRYSTSVPYRAAVRGSEEFISEIEGSNYHSKLRSESDNVRNVRASALSLYTPHHM
jgi:hypothetical protein